MKAQELRDIARRLLRIADEMEAGQIEANARELERREGLHVTLPGNDLFSMLEKGEVERIEQASDSDEGTVTKVDGEVVETLSEPKARAYQRVGCKMKDDVIVAADTMKVGRSTGYCQRSDIERTLRRLYSSASREEIREAVNGAVAELGLMCVTHNSYRYYRRNDRGRIIATATAKLCESSEDLKKRLLYEDRTKN